MLKRILLLAVLIIVPLHAQIKLSGLTQQTDEVTEPVLLNISRELSSGGDSVSIILTFNMNEEIHIYAAESLFFRIKFIEQQGLGDVAIFLPKGKPYTNFDKSVVPVYVNGQQVRISAGIADEKWLLKGTLQYQACDNTMCFTPRKVLFTANAQGTLETKPYSESEANVSSGKSEEIAAEGLPAAIKQFTITGSRGGFLKSDVFSEFLDNPSAEKSTFEGKGLFLIILLILLGGVALNLTPCVLPMIPITVAVIGAGAQAKTRGRGMFVGAVYGLAMALTYGILGLVVVITGTQFGVINSSPLFNIIIAVVFIIMALAMFDIVQIDFTRFRKKSSGDRERGKLLTVFLMGILASVLAGACVAPVVISVVIYAGSLYSSGETAGLLLPFLLGAGMALPWPFAGAGLSFLPKPGKWMVWVKYIFGIFIILMALYYGYVGISLYQETKVPETVIENSSENVLPWIHSLNDGLKKAADENRPVFIDFWATWCKNCKAMDATAFKDPEVQKNMSRFVLVKYQAEKPEDPETKKVLDYFRVVGLPTYVILEPK